VTSGPTPEVGVPTCYRHPGRETYVRCQHCDRPICPDCMHQAAVGYQCPTCVSEGKKSTRSGRTAYGGLRSGNPGLTSTVLIAINVVVWLVLSLATDAATRLYGWLALLPTSQCLSRAQPGAAYASIGSEQVCLSSTQSPGDGVWAVGVADGAYWQLFTSAFTHLEWWHIGFNMLAIWFLGPQLEQAVGRGRFLALYLLSALAGSTVVYWFASPVGSTIGASGAVFGLMAALLVLAYKIRGDTQMILGWIGISFLITVVGRGFISWQGHLGGFLGGLLIAAILVYSPRPRRTLWQAIGIVAISLGLVVAILARTATLT
jgi:membrane associated rhomboid family serine protease